jgi:hypothetical protein
MHHYVTLAYLEGMLADGESRLWVYERNSDRVFRNIPKNLATKRAYYTIVGKDGADSDVFEKMLGEEIEGPGISALRRLSRDTRQLNWQERLHATALIAVQELRVPYMREQLSEMMKGLYTAFMHRTVSEPGRLEKYLKERQAAGKASAGVSAAEMRNAVMDGGIKLEMKPEASLRAMGHSLRALISTYAEMRWTVLIANDGEFVTSDCPVCRDYPETHSMPAGLVNPDLTLYFPFSRSRALRLSHDEKKMRIFRILMQQGREREATRLRGRTPEISYRPATVNETNSINTLIIKRAQRWVYSPSENPSIPAEFRGDCANLKMAIESQTAEGWLKWTTKIQ